MASSSTVKVTFLGDASSLAKASRQAQGDIDGVGRKAKGGGGMLAGLGKSFVAAGAVIGAASIFKSFIAEAEESRKISRLTEAAIKSTGGAAKITAKQVGDLATAISNKTGVDDEAVQSASNLLLTFTKVRNEVGKGNDIFNQATQAAVDMSVVLGTDAKTASLQLGKALNDPVKGVTALTKAGVSFTQQQKDQIKEMVKAGDTLGAQKLILKEMSVQFGGAAEAAATPMEKLKVTVGNLKERIGTALLPVVDRLATFVATRVVPGIERLVTQFKEGTGTGGKLREAFENMRATFERNRPQIEAVAQALARVGEFILTKVIPVVVSLYINHIARLVDAFKAVTGVVRSLVGVILDVFGTIIGAAASAFGWVPGIGRKLKAAAREFNTFRDRVNAALDGVNKNVNVSVRANLILTGQSSLRSVERQMADDKPKGGRIPRANGGPVRRGASYLVGENEPELFVPNTSGQIFNGKQMAAMNTGPQRLHRGDLDYLADRLVSGLNGVAGSSQRMGAARVAR